MRNFKADRHGDSSHPGTLLDQRRELLLLSCPTTVAISLITSAINIRFARALRHSSAVRVGGAEPCSP
jgi:hypothetical protein